MNRSVVIARETAVSVFINVALSLLFFTVIFGLRQRISLVALGPDFLPQSFMVALMGSLVPALLLRRNIGGAARPIIQRSLAIAFVSAAVAGGGAYLVCASSTGQLEPYWALALKAMFGGLLAAIVTPLALVALFRSSGGPA